jgi:hypothetical protein
MNIMMTIVINDCNLSLSIVILILIPELILTPEFDSEIPIRICSETNMIHVYFTMEFTFISIVVFIVISSMVFIFIAIVEFIFIFMFQCA